MIIDICGINFEVILRDPVSRDDTNFGKCDCKTAKIYIDNSMPREVIDATLIHEWIHGVLVSNAIDHTEILVSVLSTELYRNGWRIRQYETEADAND
jgi:hypothetical protein